MMWLNDNRAAIKSEHPELKATEVVKIGAQMWKELGEAEKFKYQKKSAEAKKEFAASGIAPKKAAKKAPKENSIESILDDVMARLF